MSAKSQDDAGDGSTISSTKGDRLLGEVRSTGLVRYFGTDQLGSVRVVFDAVGAAIGRSDYLPFGEGIDASGTLPIQRFTGQERDRRGDNPRFAGPGAGSVSQMVTRTKTRLR